MKDSSVYSVLTEKFNFPQSRYLPRILAELVTPDEVRLLLRLPASVKEIAQEFSLGEETVSERLLELMRKGLAIPRVKEGETRYFLVRSALQFHDSTGIYEAAGKQFQELWRQWRETEFYELCREWERMPVPLMRVFPYRKAIKERDGILPYEDLESIAATARAIAVVKCVCRLLMKRCDKPLEVCMTFDAAAEFAVKRGVGRKIEAKEALDIFQFCGEQGLVPSNLNGARVTAMCFCCPDCCIFIQPLRQYGYRLLSPSRYEARVDLESCNGCQECVERCQFEAIEMRRYSRRLKAKVHLEKCYGCGVCVVNCAPQALTLKLVRPPEYIPETGPRY